LVFEPRCPVGDGIVPEVAEPVAGRAAGEVIKGGDAGNDGGEAAGTAGSEAFGEVLTALDSVAVHAGAGKRRDHAGGAAGIR